MRFLLLLLLCSAATITHAQNIDADIEKGVRQYNQMRDFMDGLKTPEDKDLDTMINYINRGTPLLTNALNNGNAEQKATARYFLAMLQYELGFVYGQKGYNRKSYPVFKAIGPDMDHYSDSTSFPLHYKYDNKNYQIVFGNFAPTASEYYTGMGEVCTNLSKFDEAIPYLEKAIRFPYTTPWFMYIAANKIWQIRSKKGNYDQLYLDYSLSGLQYCSRLDTSYQSVIRSNNYTDCVDYADTIRKILSTAGIANKPAAYARAAAYLDTAGYTYLAADFYRNAYILDAINKPLLRQMISFAHRHGDKDMEKEMEAALDKASAGETDVVIRNLGTTLAKVMLSANDPKKHFDDLKGRKFNVPHYGGNPYHSSIELDGALNTFITDFLKNSQHNYYYWKSFIAEEPKSNLEGKLKQRYQAICDELRSLYPEAAVTYMYNDPHYFTMQINSNVTIEFNYYYNEGYKDMLLLSVNVETVK